MPGFVKVLSGFAIAFFAIFAQGPAFSGKAFAQYYQQAQYEDMPADGWQQPRSRNRQSDYYDDEPEPRPRRPRYYDNQQDDEWGNNRVMRPRGDGGYGNSYEGGGRWRPCSAEGGFCRAPAGAIIRYGVAPYFTTRRSPPGGLPCRNRFFGDPAPGIPKACYVRG